MICLMVDHFYYSITTDIISIQLKTNFMTLAVLTGLCVVIYFPLSCVRFLFVKIEADDSFWTALSAGKLLGVGTHALSSGCLKSAQPLEDALDSGLTLKCGGSATIPAANFDGREACQW